MASAAVDQLSNQNVIVRKLTEFPESIWGDRFTSFTLDKQVYDIHAEEIGMLKEEVRNMLVDPQSTTMEKLSLIDTVERLGISYHFNKEIEEQIQEIYHNFKDYPNCDLSAGALQFRLFRQHGFNISSGIFYQYMDDNGKFKESLSNDLKGLLNLYEAAHVRTHEDKLLEEALAFTTTHLKHGVEGMAPHLTKQVNNALEQPLHRGIPRIETLHYISVYEEDESKNCKLLRLAKLDYHLLQLLYKQELSEVLRWWKDLDIASKIPYFRERMVECYFWGVGAFFEPQYSLSRITFAKTGIFLTIVDDTYDAYGTLEELKAFTEALERWDGKEVDGLPDYMKTAYSALLTFCERLENHLTKEGRSYAFSKYKEEFIQYARTSYNQAYWFITRELPPFPDYVNNGVITSAYFLLTPTAFLGMDCGTKNVFDWLSDNPKILVACCKICRLINDVASHESEKERSATGLDCYMKHYNVSEEQAMKKLEEMCEDAWKDINEEFLKPTAMPREILTVFLNLARIIDVVYKHHEDGFTNPHKVLQRHIVAVLENPIAI